MMMGKVDDRQQWVWYSSDPCYGIHRLWNMCYLCNIFGRIGINLYGKRNIWNIPMHFENIP